MEFDVTVEIPRGTRNKYVIQDLEPGKRIDLEHGVWADHSEAEAEVNQSRDRARPSLVERWEQRPPAPAPGAAR